MLPTRRGNRTMMEDANPSFNRGMIAETGIVPTGFRLIQDTFSFDIIDKKNIVVEGRDGKELPAMRVSGLIQMGDKENANGRFYSTQEVLRPAVSSIQDDISGRAVMGEFDHPADAKIHLDRVSHLMTKVWMDGRKVFGEAEILHNLPCGACLRGLFEHKVRVGISSRGVGDMEVVENAGKELYRVMPGYAFVTWDAVAEPSVNGAILQIQEGLNRRLRPVKNERNRFSPDVYNNLLVSEINKFFSLK
tara:strand:- start:4318 stop:5061 length:744 start_codon:yes stop_codon:yes gene_type:complete